MYKKHFPIFVNRPKIVYLDSAATALKPQTVVDATVNYYTNYSANIARGVYPMAEEATNTYENARKTVATFIGASPDEVVFTHGTTESLNLVAYGIEEHLRSIRTKVNIVVTAMEHHANFVPWQMLAKRTNAEFRVVKITSDGKIDQKDLLQKVDKKTMIFAFTAVSNVLGTINPIVEIANSVRERSSQCIIIVDCAQIIAHTAINVRSLCADAIAFSGHKIGGPTGVGILWGKKDLLKKIKPLHYGGEMISSVTTSCTTFKEPPHIFEGGTPHIAGAIGIAAAISFICSIGYEKIATHNQQLTNTLIDGLYNTFSSKILTIYGPQVVSERAPLVSFSLHGYHPHDVATILGSHNVCVRAGQHCAMPLHKEYLRIPATIRASLWLYNNEEDVGMLLEGLKKAVHTLR